MKINNLFYLSYVFIITIYIRKQGISPFSSLDLEDTTRTRSPKFYKELPKERNTLRRRLLYNRLEGRYFSGDLTGKVETGQFCTSFYL